MEENEARLLVRAHSVSLDIHDHSTYVDIAKRCGLIPEPELIIEQNEEVTVE